jgi:hypothetical protein
MRASDIGVQVSVEFVAAGRFMLLATFLMQSHRALSPLNANILDSHFERRANPGEDVDHQHNKRLVALSSRGGWIGRVEEALRLLCR